jgi:hypothetical protein
MEPRRRDRIDLQRCEGDRAQHAVEMGGKQGLKDVPQAVIMERGTRSPRLQQRQQPTLIPPFSHLGEGRMPIQNRAYQGFNPTPT